MIQAVVFDLFGTLVDAPTPLERTNAVHRLAAAVGSRAETVDRYLEQTRYVRHDGTLPDVADVCANLVAAIGAHHGTTEVLGRELRDIGLKRLASPPSVLAMLQQLRRDGLRLGVLSDAPAEIAEVWPSTDFAPLIDAAVFSCRAGAVKPDASLYERLQKRLGVETSRVLYVGDGGGDELRGAQLVGMNALGVRRRGAQNALAYGVAEWAGPYLDAVEDVPNYLGEQL